MKIIECEQGSPEWFAARVGKVTASCMEKIITPTGKESTQADKYMNQIIAEIITGESAEAFNGNIHTDRGKEYEEEAVNYYAMLNGIDPKKIGFCVTDDDKLGCSPDRFVGEDGMLEIKTGLPHVLIESALNNKLEQEHRPQTQCGLFVTGRVWVDTMLYNPKMKPIIIRAKRNNSFIVDMNTALTKFHAGMTDKIRKLKTSGYME